MKIVRSHNMTTEAARDWIEAQMPGLLRQFGASVRGAQHRWQGDVMHFSFSVSVAGQFQGTLEVTDSDYVLNIPMGFIQKVFEGRARTAIEGWSDENLR